MRDPKSRDVDVPVAARLVRPDQHIGAIAQFLFEVGQRITRIAGDRARPELLRKQAFEQRRLGPSEIAGLYGRRRRNRESDAECQPTKTHDLAFAALAARRGRVRLETIGIVSVPLNADHRQNDDAAAVIARLDQSGSDGATVRRECDYNPHLPLPRPTSARRIGSRMD
jgi:hypothetical protein